MSTRTIGVLGAGEVGLISIVDLLGPVVDFSVVGVGSPLGLLIPGGCWGELCGGSNPRAAMLSATAQSAVPPNMIQ